jgi:hypothetical protein
MVILLLAQDQIFPLIKLIFQYGKYFGTHLSSKELLLQLDMRSRFLMKLLLIILL